MLRLSLGDGIMPGVRGGLLPYKNRVVAVVGRLLSLVVMFEKVQPFTCFLADRTATQYDRLLAAACCPSVRLSVCDAVHCGSQGWCTGLKVVPTCS